MTVTVNLARLGLIMMMALAASTAVLLLTGCGRPPEQAGLAKAQSRADAIARNEPDASDGTRSGRKVPAPTALARLIEDLASGNPEPNVRDLGPVRRFPLPDGWNEDAAIRAKHAWLELRELELKAVPDLVEHIDDERYATTERHGLSSTFHNLTVGTICRDLLRGLIEPYPRYRDIESRNRRPPYLPEDKEGLLNWWDDHKDRTLFEIQSEAFDRSIERDQASEQESDKLGLDEMIELRKRLRESGRPFPPDPGEWSDH